ncbi:MAG: Ig-like domain-containing protein, partial [Steroidobacteraceae bacterium]|nr:Ig-like domain-containing protein [Deltaproteobacteria bacterium]
MKKFKTYKDYLVFILMLGVFLALPGRGEASFDDDDDNITVTATSPANAATGVPIGSKLSATFSAAMKPATINTTTFTLKRGTTAVAGTVTYAGVIAAFKPTVNLLSGTVYTATITTGARGLDGHALARNHVWKFTTGATADTTRPSVSSTVPVNAAAGVPIGSKLTATFSEVMAPATISATTFTLNQGATSVPGAVTYSGVTAVFTPTIFLSSGTIYTATITTGARDLAGNALAVNKVWSFTTGSVQDSIAPTVTLVNPAVLATGVCVNKTIAATFSEALDPLTVNTTNFKVTGATGVTGVTAVTGTVTYNAASRIATFTPAGNLAANTTYTATITTGVKDLAGNALAVNKIWTFTTTTTSACTTSVALGAAAPFGGFGGGSGMTNQGVFTVINGNIGTTAASTLITGFHDSGANVYTETTSNIGAVNGTIYTATAPPGSAPGVIAAAAALAAQTAFNNLSPAA